MNVFIRWQCERSDGVLKYLESACRDTTLREGRVEQSRAIAERLTIKNRRYEEKAEHRMNQHRLIYRDTILD